MNEKIEEGDFVDVHFSSQASLFSVKVLYTPSATGDSWRLKTDEGIIIYVQSFSLMILKQKGDKSG